MRLHLPIIRGNCDEILVSALCIDMKAVWIRLLNNNPELGVIIIIVTFNINASLLYRMLILITLNSLNSSTNAALNFVRK